MKYEEANKKSLTVKWKVDTCNQGEKCWCRVIKCDPPIIFKEKKNFQGDEYYPVRSGELDKDTAEHIVEVHNLYLQSLPFSNYTKLNENNC